MNSAIQLQLQPITALLIKTNTFQLSDINMLRAKNAAGINFVLDCIICSQPTLMVRRSLHLSSVCL